MHRFGQNFKAIHRFGQKFVNHAARFGRKISDFAPKAAAAIENYGTAIGNERLAQFGKDLNGPIVSNELQNKIVNKGLNAIENASGKLSNMMV